MKALFTSRISWRTLFMAMIVIFMVVPLVCVGYLYIAFIAPVGEKAETFDLSQLNLPESLPGAIHHAIPVQDLPKHVIHALISREDPRFYEHSGIDYTGMARAFWSSFRCHSAQGSSTITRQLSLNSFDLSGHRNRQLLILALARRIEQKFTKAEILQFYLNRIYFGTVAGKSLCGIEAASLTYFGKKTSALSLSEGAMLIGLIRSPSRFSPYRDTNAALVERNEVLHRMEQNGWITEKVLDSALKEPLSVKPQP